MLSLATDFSMHMDGWGTGSWFLMGIGMVLFWGLIVLGIVWLIRAVGHPSPQTLSARDVLERRLAEGDISVEEYRQRRDALADDASTNPAT